MLTRQWARLMLLIGKLQEKPLQLKIKVDVVHVGHSQLLVPLKSTIELKEDKALTSQNKI